MGRKLLPVSVRAAPAWLMCCWALLGLSTVALLPVRVHAQTRSPAAPTGANNVSDVRRQYEQLSSYERETLDDALASRGLQLEPNPDGKVLQGFEIMPLEVIEQRDPAPGFLNWFHWKTQSRVIEREILARPGEPWVAWRAAETARRLRNLRQLSLVLVFPVKGSDPRSVKLLVITKDVWSLRLNSSWRFKDGRLEYMLLQPSEENLYGTHLRVAGLYAYDRVTNSYGGVVSHPRVLGTHLAFVASASTVVERSTGHIDGTVGQLSFVQPLFSSDTKWAYGSQVAWNSRVVRWLWPDANGALVRRTYDSPSTPENDRLPWEYQTQNWYWITSVTRSFGLKSKQDISWGLEAQRHRYQPVATQARFEPQIVSEFFREQVERSDARIGPFARLDIYSNEYISLVNVETLGLQEDYAVGHRAFLKAYGASQAASATRNLLGVVAGMAYTLPLDDGLATAWAIHNWEWTGHADQNDASVQAGIRLVTPSLGPVRAIYDAGALSRYHDYLHVRYALGGDNRLRGYPSQEFIGSNFLVSNLELRTKPVRLWTLLFGLSGFYDAGDAWDKAAQFQPKHALGVGIRGLAPQLQRIVGRLECAFPLDRPQWPGQHWGGVDVMLTIEGQPFGPPELVSRGSPLLLPAE